MKWYDFFSNFYDNSLEKLYFGSRKRAVELLDLKDGNTVLDVACGTGANFKHIMLANRSIQLFGTDYSEGMLRRAQELVSKNGWSGIRLFQADARALNPSTLPKLTDGVAAFDRVICVLGLSVIPDWEMVMENMLAVLKPGGRVVIVDVFAEKRDFNTWLVEKIAKADLDRNIVQVLKGKSTEFYLEYLPVKESKVGGRLFVATGLRQG